MIKKKEQCAVEHKAHAFGAEGNIHICSLVSGRGELNEKGRAFAHTSVDVGAGIGYHEHHGETEWFYILSGEGEFCDNGTWQPVRAGDVTVTPDGCGHALRNTGSVPLEFVALILDS
jgi:mannose-6-phosphate isomerase-like protein (cupin superfamily)